MYRQIVNSRQTTASRFRHADLASQWFKYRVQALDREPFSEVYRYRYDPHNKQTLARLIQRLNDLWTSSGIGNCDY